MVVMKMALQMVFASYSDHAVHFMELPGEIPNRWYFDLCFFFSFLLNANC